MASDWVHMSASLISHIFPPHLSDHRCHKPWLWGGGAPWPAPSQSGSPIITGIGSSVTNGYTHVNFITNPGNLHYNMDVLSLLIHLNGCKIKKISALVFYPWYRGHLVKWRLYSDDNTILVAISESNKLSRVRRQIWGNIQMHFPLVCPEHRNGMGYCW